MPFVCIDSPIVSQLVGFGFRVGSALRGTENVLAVGKEDGGGTDHSASGSTSEADWVAEATPSKVCIASVLFIFMYECLCVWIDGVDGNACCCVTQNCWSQSGYVLPDTVQCRGANFLSGRVSSLLMNSLLFFHFLMPSCVGFLNCWSSLNFVLVLWGKKLQLLDTHSSLRLIDWLFDWLFTWLIDWLIDWFTVSYSSGTKNPFGLTEHCVRSLKLKTGLISVVYCPFAAHWELCFQEIRPHFDWFPKAPMLWSTLRREISTPRNSPQ